METGLPPLSKGLDDRAPLSQGLDPALFKYLGDMIDQHLSFNNHIKNVANKISKKLGVLRRLRFSFAMAAAELLYKTMIVQIFGLNTKELNATLGLVPLINGRKLHIVFLTRKCLEGSVPPFLNNYFNSVVSSASVVGWGCFTPFICGGISLTCEGIH